MYNDIPCKEWGGAKNEHGYGVVRYIGRQTYVHRVEWEEHNGPIPEGMEIMHLCHNRACYELAHLAMGTHAENMQEASDIGSFYGRYAAGGEDNGRAKLTDDNIREIRAMLNSGYLVVEIAEIYGVNRHTISDIKNGRRWAHVL